MGQINWYVLVMICRQSHITRFVQGVAYVANCRVIHAVLQPLQVYKLQEIKNDEKIRVYIILF